MVLVTGCFKFQLNSTHCVTVMTVIPVYAVGIYWGLNLAILVGCSIHSSLQAKKVIARNAAAYQRLQQLKQQYDVLMRSETIDKVQKPKLCDVFQLWFDSVIILHSFCFV